MLYFAGALTGDGARLLQTNQRGKHDESLARAVLSFARAHERKLIGEGRYILLQEIPQLENSPGGFVEYENREGVHGVEPAVKRGSTSASGVLLVLDRWDSLVSLDVPLRPLRSGGEPGWSQIAGPNSMFARLAERRGEPRPEFPEVRNIERIISKEEWASGAG